MQIGDNLTAMFYALGVGDYNSNKSQLFQEF